MRLNALPIAFVIILAACSANAAERNNTANGLASQGDYQAAIDAYQAAQVIEPDHPIPYFNAALAFINEQDFDQAEAALRQAATLADGATAADSFYNLGNLYFTQEKYPEAVEAFREALRNDPTHEDARHNLEITMGLIERPTPTAMEMRTRPEEQQVNPTAQPSPNPSGNSIPTPTPPPPEDLPPPGPSPVYAGDESGEQTEETDATVAPIVRGTLSVEQAQQVLDPIELDQDTLGNFPDDPLPQTPPTGGKDW